MNEIRVERVIAADERKGFQWAEPSQTLKDDEAIDKFAASLDGRSCTKYRIYEKRIG